MISEAYVWVHLPGDTKPTVCGLFSYKATVAGNVGTFVYGKSYLLNPDAIALDPFALPLSPKDYLTTWLNGVFGTLSDAVPDDWGRYVIDKTRGHQEFPIGYMLNLLDDSIGNISFSGSPAIPPLQDEPIGIELVPHAREILLDIEQGKPIPIELKDKIRPNTAMGGARPKLTVQYKDALWLAKFPSSKDNPAQPYAKLEAAMLLLAGKCRINAVDAEVVLGDVLLVRRFDRGLVKSESFGVPSQWRRDSFLSARTVLQSNPGSYANFARELTRYSTDAKADKEQLFRRMVFNVLISNTDDHDRNHGLLADDIPGTYRLSPAYDLVPRLHGTIRHYHALALGNGDSLATRENLLADSEAFGLTNSQAESIIQSVESGVSTHWRSCLLAQGLAAAEVESLRGCFAGLFDSKDAIQKALDDKSSSFLVVPGGPANTGRKRTRKI